MTGRRRARAAPARPSTPIARSRAVLVSVLFAIAWLVAAEPFALLPEVVRGAASLVAISLIGYAVSVTLLPDGLSAGGRLVVTLGAALAVPVAGAFLLTVTPWGIGSWEFLAFFVIAFIAAVGIGLWRVPEAWRRPWGIPRVDRRTAVAVAFYAIAVGGAVVAIDIRADVASQPVATATELSLDAEALAAGRVEAHVVSHEHRTMQFRLDFTIDGETVLSRTASVTDGEEWVVSLPDASAGDRVIVTLYRLPDDQRPYRSVVATVPRLDESAPPSGGD